MVPKFFPPAMQASPEGLVCVGGRLSVDLLLDAYRHGIFPWPQWNDGPMMWWSLDPRAILPLDGLHISRRLVRSLRTASFHVTCNVAFSRVIGHCSRGPGREGGTWITPEMIEAYCRLHRMGHAHSVEVWRDDLLAGGVYGVAIGGLFAAESMFYRARDESKVALVHLVAHLCARGYLLLDLQQWTPHMGRMGAVEISRDAYLRRLADAVDLPVTFGDGLCGGGELKNGKWTAGF